MNKYKVKVNVRDDDETSGDGRQHKRVHTNACGRILDDDSQHTQSCSINSCEFRKAL